MAQYFVAFNFPDFVGVTIYIVMLKHFTRTTAAVHAEAARAPVSGNDDASNQVDDPHGGIWMGGTVGDDALELKEAHEKKTNEGQEDGVTNGETISVIDLDTETYQANLTKNGEDISSSVTDVGKQKSKDSINDEEVQEASCVEKRSKDISHYEVHQFTNNADVEKPKCKEDAIISDETQEAFSVEGQASKDSSSSSNNGDEIHHEFVTYVDVEEQKSKDCGGSVEDNPVDDVESKDVLNVRETKDRPAKAGEGSLSARQAVARVQDADEIVHQEVGCLKRGAPMR